MSKNLINLALLFVALCTTNVLSADVIIKNEISNYDDFLFLLDDLSLKTPISIVQVDKTNNPHDEFISESFYSLENPVKSTYVFIEKENNHCIFPKYLTHYYDGFYQSYAESYSKENFTGIKTSANKKFFVTTSDVERKKTKLIRLDKVKSIKNNDIQFCNKFLVKHYDFDIKDLFLKQSNEFDSYYLSISNKNLKRIENGIPDREIYADTSDYKFKKVDAYLSIDNNKYNISVKLRGNTKQHWIYKKKSYTIRPKKDSFFSEKLFFIPERRAILGEHLINKISKFIGLQALESSFGKLYINDIDNGLYYVSDAFNKDFLFQNNLPKANIYHTDSHKTPTSKFSVADMKNDMFISDIKEYKENFNRDTDYFIKILNQDSDYLEKNWKLHFDEDNLIKILSIHFLSGTRHYDLHNLFFYINPVNGKIFFFPWDFMNYSNAHSLRYSSNFSGETDYRNYSQFLTKLLSIKEVRYLRNNFIQDNGELIKEFIKNFEDKQVPNIYFSMIADNTIPLSMGEWGRSSFGEFMEIPGLIVDNIDFQLDKLNENPTKLNISLLGGGADTLKLDFKLQSYAGIRINCIEVIYEDKYKQSCSEKGTKYFSDIQYTEVYGSTINIIPTHHIINLKTENNRIIKNIKIQYSNLFDEKNINEIQLNYPTNLQLELDSFIDNPSDNNLYPEVLEKKGSTYYFKDKKVLLKKNIILPKGTELKILPGTSIFLDKNISIITYGSINAIGDLDNIIEFLPLSKSAWGSIAMVGDESINSFNFCNFKGGSGSYYQGKYFTAMLAAHDVNNVKISNCLFQNAVNTNGGDDAINIKNSKVLINHSDFINNDGDAVDFDFVHNGSGILNSEFINNGNDALDISLSNVFIKDSRIFSSGDKGISVGENSNLSANNLFISKTKIGIASKDGSFVDLSNSNLSDNILGVGLFNKKRSYKNSSINIFNSSLKGNYINCGQEEFNKYGNKQPIIYIDSLFKKTNKNYRYKINSDISGLSKKDAIRAFYNNGNLDEYIDYVTFIDCEISKQ